MPETKKVTLQLRGQFLGVEPSTVLPPPQFTPVYTRQGPPGVWNFINLTKGDDGKYVAIFIDANVKLRNDDTGAMNACDPALPGSWAVAHGADLPPDWPAKLIFDNGLCLDVVFL